MVQIRKHQLYCLQLPLKGRLTPWPSVLVPREDVAVGPLDLEQMPNSTARITRNLLIHRSKVQCLPPEIIGTILNAEQKIYNKLLQVHGELKLGWSSRMPFLLLKSSFISLQPACGI